VWTDSDITPYYLLGTGTVTLPQTGTYTLWVQNFSITTGSETFQLYDVPSPSGTLTSGGSGVTVTTTTPGQEETLTFSGTAGQDASIFVTNVSTPVAFVSLLASSGTLLSTIEIGPTSGSEYYILQCDPLPATDTYTVWVQHSGSYTGSETLQLYLSTDLTGTITAGGSAVTATTTTPGQNAQYTFSGTTGENVYLMLTDTALQEAFVNLIAPDGTYIGWTWMDSDIGPNYQFNGGSITLPQTGTYTWSIQNYSPTTGSITMQMDDVPTPSGTLTSGGSAVTVTTTTPGQDEALTFSGTAGQDASIFVTNISTEDAFVNLMTSSGTVLGSIEIGPTSGSAFYTLQWDPLPATDTYTVYIQHVGSYTGSETFQLYLSTDLTGTITAGGSAVTVTTTSPGQNAKYTFSGTAGENVFLTLTGVTSFQDAYVNLLAPDGTNLGWVWIDSAFDLGFQLGNTGSISLPQTGTYTLWLQNISPTAGSVTMQLYDPPADVTGTITVGGSPVTVTTTSVGQGVLLTFNGTAGQTVTTTIGTGSTSGFGFVFLLDPDSNIVDDTLYGYVGGTDTFTFGPDTLPTTGTYTIWMPALDVTIFEAYGAVYGTETVQIY